MEGRGKKGEEGSDQSSEDNVDKLLVYKKILELLQPGETVTKVVSLF